MQVSLSQKLNQPTSLPTFKADPSLLILLKIRHLADQADAVVNSKHKIAKALQKPLNIEEVRTSIADLSGLSSKADKGFWYHFGRMFSLKPSRKGTPKIGEMKTLALEKLFPILDDNNGFNRAAKTSLLTSMLTTGEYLNKTFVDTFKNLPDKHYFAFKQELLNKVLYTGNASNDPKKYIYGFQLLQAIDNPKYAGFLQSNIDGVNNLIALIDRESYKKLTKNKNEAFQYYCRDFVSYNTDNDVWQPHLQKTFYTKIQQAEFKPEKIAAALNIRKEQAEDIVKDLQALYSAERSEKPQEFLEKRLKEKFKTDKTLYQINETSKNSYFADNEHSEMTSAELKIDNLETFISKTSYKDALKEKFKDNFAELDKEYLVLEKRYIQAQESLDREMELTAWAHQL